MCLGSLWLPSSATPRDEPNPCLWTKGRIQVRWSRGFRALWPAAVCAEPCPSVITQAAPPSLSGSQGTQRTVLTLPKMEKEHPANTCWSLLNSLAVSKCHPNLTVQFSHSVMSDSLRPHGLQHTRPPCPSPTPRVYPNSCPLIQWCHPTISSSVVPFSSCPQSFPASGSFPPLRMKWPKYCSFSFSISPSN